MTRAEAIRAEAISELLSRPDEPCLRRGHVYTQEGDATFSDEIKRMLAVAYVGHQSQRHRDISRVVTTWRQKKLRLMRAG